MLRNKRIISLLIAVMVVSTIFGGCGQSKITTSKIIKVNIAAVPKTIDPGLNNSLEGGIVITNAFEGLVSLDKNNKIIPGVAEKWNISKDGLTYTFDLKKDAKWSNGTIVTAKDFEYAWQRELDPKIASPIAYKLYYLKNGQAFNNKKVTADQVGVKSIDNNTLVVTLEAPTPYFLSLLATPAYNPVPKDIVSKNSKWTMDSKTYISNGPFKIIEYKNDSLNFEKNPNYWDSKNVKLDNIEFKTISNENSYYSTFKTGELDLITAPPMSETPELLKNGTAKTYPYMGTYFYNFNMTGNNLSTEAAKALKDVRVRKALSLAIDRTAIVEKVTQSGQLPATSLIPGSTLNPDVTKFKTKDYFSKTANIEEAKKLLAEAGYKDGKGFPSLEILYNTMQGHKIIAEAIQDMWKKNLGVDITLRNVERQVQLSEVANKNYTISRGGLIGEYNDPMTFLDTFTSYSKQNNSGYNNSEYNKLIAESKTESNITKRTELLHKAEDTLMNDMPILPIYEYTDVVCINKKLKDVNISPLGYMFFKNAYLQE